MYAFLAFLHICLHFDINIEVNPYNIKISCRCILSCIVCFFNKLILMVISSCYLQVLKPYWALGDLDGHLNLTKAPYGDKRNIQDIVEI